MTEAINQQAEDEPLEEMKDLTAQWANYFNGIQQVLEACAGKGLVIDAKWKWADDYFAEDSGHLDCELKAEMVLADFNQETKFNWPPKKMTQHLNAYCQFADHLQCLNPVSITHKQKDGERWIKRDGDPF